VSFDVCEQLLESVTCAQYLELERWDEAYEAFRNATNLQPRHVLAWPNHLEEQPSHLPIEEAGWRSWNTSIASKRPKSW